jgi:hypothetical protein
MNLVSTSKRFAKPGLNGTAKLFMRIGEGAVITRTLDAWVKLGIR